MKRSKNEEIERPLCVFTFSPPFQVRAFTGLFSTPTSGYSIIPSWRRSRPWIKPKLKSRKPTPLAKYFSGRIIDDGETVTLKEVLDTVRHVWASNTSLKSPTNTMDYKKPPADISSPVLSRRRLSAPEILMRKHMLAQQMSDSQDSDVTQSSDVQSCRWRYETNVGSDPNLNRKRDHGLMRKSTLMRRLWGSTKPFSLGNSRYKLSQQSLGSPHSSPEHSKCRSRSSLNDEVSPLSKKFEESPRITTFRSQDNSLLNQKKVQNTLNVPSSTVNTSCCSNYTQETPNSTNSRTSTKISSTITETESEHYSTRSTSRTGTTTFSDNSDSAYTNSTSNFNSKISSSVGATTYSSNKFVEDNGNVSDQNANDRKLQEEHTGDGKNDSWQNINDTSTQTSAMANLNVISNVHLSRSTLNLIFNHVMQDVEHSPPTNINISTITAKVPPQETTAAVPQPKLIQVQRIPSFYLDQKDLQQPANAHQKVLKYMVSNVGTGSPYSKPTEAPQVVVPRYSALPRTTSMEVNTSSGDSTDKDSDNISLVDSLEDPSSPRVDLNQNKYDDKPTGGDFPLLLPDNSSVKSSKISGKGSAFFVPIKSNGDIEIKSVADHLPEKVREKLSKRQLKREQKQRQTDKTLSSKSDSNYVSASDNGNQLNQTLDNAKYISSASSALPEINVYKSKYRSKPLLPNIISNRKHKANVKSKLKQIEEDKLKERKIKNSKRKPLSKLSEQPESSVTTRKTHWISETRQKIISQKGEQEFLPRTIVYRAGNSNKRIEVLEIIECVDKGSKNVAHNFLKPKKSKIPVLVNPKLPNITKPDKFQKPVFLDFEQVHEAEPKIDQLIANILIDALNKTDIKTARAENLQLSRNFAFVSEKCPSISQPSYVIQQGAKYHQTFEIIPEERTTSVPSSSEASSSSDEKGKSQKVSSESTSSKKTTKTFNRSTKSSLSDENKGKAALDHLRDEHFSAIPKGWITFYTLHKSQGSPESTSDEGKKRDISNRHESLTENRKTKKRIDKTTETEEKEEKNTKLFRKNATTLHNTRLVPADDKDNSLDSWTNSEETSAPAFNMASTFFKENQQSREHQTHDKSSEWTVTVSGTSRGVQMAPDLEMRLTFPQNERQPNGKNKNFSDLSAKDVVPSNRKNGLKLPEIIKQRSSKKRHCESGHVIGLKDYIEPRQTRTSTRRFLLNRPRTFMAPADLIEIENDNSTLREMFKDFPEFLKITGNTINPERKPRVPTMSEKDLNRQTYRNP